MIKSAFAAREYIAITKLMIQRSIFVTHTLPIEMGRLMARVARVCLLCLGMHLGDEKHYVFECPTVENIRRRHFRLFDNSHRTMRLFTGDPNQKSFASCLLQILDEIDELLD